jgi:hypothetical protein
MKRLLLATALAFAATASPVHALEVGEFVTLLGPSDAIGCTQFEDTRAGVFFSARYGRQNRWQFVDEVNDLGEKGRSCRFMSKSEYRVVNTGQGGTGIVEYFCVTQPGWNSCLWVHLIGPVIRY